jgi:AAA domain/DnaB-like helicase N terminal domain
MMDRTPPHDADAEQALIGIAITAGRVPEPATQLRPTDFYRIAHSILWAACTELNADGHPCDALSVNARLMERHQIKQAADALRESLTYPLAADPEHLTRIIVDRACRRHIIDSTTRTLQDAYESADEAEAILQRAESALANVPSRDTGNVDSLITLDEFLGQQAPEPDWIMDGLLARDERLIITGVEGLGKTTWLRQMAICTAAGMDPFTGRRTEPKTVLAIDAENPHHIMEKRYRELRQAVNAHGRTIERGRFWLDRRPDGLDLADPADRRWLQRRVHAVNPDLLVIGPAYKLHTAGNDDKDETIARTVTSVLDELRTHAECALILEHHAGNEQAGGVRPVRPFGSSLWRRWPEFGYGIRPAKHPQAEKRRIVDVVAWRGARDERNWPRHMESGGTGLPWVELEEVA